MATLNEILAAASRHLADGSVDDAMLLCRQALSRAPHAPSVLKVYGSCLLASGDLESAETVFSAASAADPDDASTSYNLGVTQQARGNAEAAKRSLERSLTLAPGNAQTHEALAAVLAEEDNMDGAIRHMLVALELKPEDPNTLTNFASVLARIGALYDARLHYEKALALDPKSQSVPFPLSIILHELGEHEQAVELLESAYLRRPRDAMTLAALGSGVAQIGDYDRATQYVEMALKIAPGLIPALDAFALIMAYRGEPEKGIAHLAAHLRQHKDNQFLYVSLAAAMTRDGRYADAIALATQAMSVPATRSAARRLILQNLALLGRFAEVVELGKSSGMQIKPIPPGSESSKDIVIIPLETKSMEAVLLARFLKERRRNATGEAIIHAPGAIQPLLQRVDTGRQILPLAGGDIVRPGAAFITQYIVDEQILAYDPERFVPYLKADPRTDGFWQGSLAPFKRPFIGITWSKYPPAPLLHDLAEALRDWPGTIFSLTWDDQRAELEGNKRIIDAGRHLTSLEALIDITGKMDCVIGPDGLAVHIAGAMGVPGIVLTTPEKSWYWHERDGRSYWYPSISVLTRPWKQSPEAFRPVIAEAVRSRIEDQASELTMAAQSS